MGSEAEHDAATGRDRPRDPAPAAGAGLSPLAARTLALQRMIGNRATARLLARDDTTLPPVPNYQLTPPTLGGGDRLRPNIVPGLYMDPNAVYDRPAAPAPPPPAIGIPSWRLIPPPPPITVDLTPTPAPPAGAPSRPGDQQPTIGVQWAWHLIRPPGSPAGPDRSVQISVQQGAAVVQASVNLDTGQVQWMAGAQAQVSTPDLHVLGAAISASAFVQLLGGLTSDQSAGGALTVQAAAGAQVTVKWGAISVSAQFGPQIQWQRGQNPAVDFTATPQAGPTSAPPAGFFGFRYDF
jgi:hypothetical protein